MRYQYVPVSLQKFQALVTNLGTGIGRVQGKGALYLVRDFAIWPGPARIRPEFANLRLYFPLLNHNVDFSAIVGVVRI